MRRAAARLGRLRDASACFARALSAAPAAAAACARTSAPPAAAALSVAQALLPGSIADAAAALASGRTTAAALTEACLQQIELTRACNAYTAVLPESARAEAAASDARRAAGAARGPLDGIPIAVKDNFCVLGAPSAAASRALEGFIAPYDATVVARLRAAGAVVLGKTNMDEFGMGSHTTNTPHGPARAPLPPSSVPHHGCKSTDYSAVPGARAGVAADVGAGAVARVAPQWDRSSGGSSGGSAAAVAALTCFAALGSDTGGSVRLPAAYTGTVGLKPTYGLLSRWGLIAYASSLDCPGVLARSCSDVAAVLEAVQGDDPLDSTCLFSLAPAAEPTITTSTASPSDASSLAGLRVGLPREFFFPELTPSVARAWDAAAAALAARGAEVVTVSLPALAGALGTYYTLAPAEAVSNLSRYDGVRYGPSTAATMPDTAAAAAAATAARAGAAAAPAGDSGGERRARPLQELYTANRTTFFGPEVQRRIAVGNFVLSSARYQAYVGTATRLRGALAAQLLAALRTGKMSEPAAQAAAAAQTAELAAAAAAETQVDVLLMPTATSGAPLLQALPSRAAADPLADLLDDLMTVGPSLAGLPAVSVPAGTEAGPAGEALPLGVQLVGPPLSERALLRIGDAVAAALRGGN
jgi:aspartyl-tRNA(Asn)/glutamyl-tRNA(Gln) amidotransferase subunit A